MKFSCHTHELLESLQLVSRAIGGQQALPILGNILIEVKGETCTVSATDLELSIITKFDAKVESEGSVTVPAKAILNFTQYNPDMEVLLEVTEGSQIKCVSSHAKATIAGEAASEYPTIASVERQTVFSLDGGPLLQALHLVTFASSKTSLRPVLSGVYVRRDTDKLTLVATDSYRLSEYVIATEGAGEELTCIIPTKILEELKLMLGSKKSDPKASEASGTPDTMNSVTRVDIALSKQQIEITLGKTRLLSRLIDGKFPDYRQIIPANATSKVLFPSKELTLVVKRMHYFAKEMNNNLTFHCSPTETRITTPQTQGGKDEATVVAEMTGDENKIALSSSYLLDFLGHISSDVVEMRLTDSMHPAVFILPDAPNFLHLVMPLRMQEE